MHVTAKKYKNAHNALKLEEGNIFYSSRGLLEHPLKQALSSFVGDGRIITIHFSLSLLHLSTAVAHKANRDKTRSYNKWLLLDVSVGQKKWIYIYNKREKRKEKTGDRYLCVLRMHRSTLHKGTQSSCSSVAVHPSWCSAGRPVWSHTHSNRSASCASACPPLQCIHQQRLAVWPRH